MTHDIPPPPGPPAFSTDEIVLYGVRPMNGDNAELAFALGADRLRLRLQLLRDGRGELRNPTIAIVYGYGYQGYCYRLDRPKTLVFLGLAAGEQASGCGFDQVPGYEMWRVQPSTELFELGGSVGRAEDLILQANMPGRQSPASYAVNMQLAQRGPRMPRTGGS